MICPCCGQPVAPKSRLQALARRQGPVRRAILEALITARTPMTPSALADVVYANAPGGGPDSAVKIIHQSVHHLKPRLVGTGWTIRADGWAGYALVPADPGARN